MLRVNAQLWIASDEKERWHRHFAEATVDQMIPRSMLNIKQRLHIDGDDFEFIRRLAEGFVTAFESRTDNTEVVRYVALTEVNSLKEVGLTAPPELPRFSDGQVVLAETRLEARPIVRSAP